MVFYLVCYIIITYVLNLVLIRRLMSSSPVDDEEEALKASGILLVSSPISIYVTAILVLINEGILSKIFGIKRK